MYGVKTGGFDSPEALNAYYDGVADGLRCFAWMRDGTSYVGTTGTTLAEALDAVDTARRTALDQDTDADESADAGEQQGEAPRRRKKR